MDTFIIILYVLVTALFLVLYVVYHSKYIKEKTENEKLTLTLKTLEEMGRDDVSKFPLDLLEKISYFKIEDCLENYQEKIANFYWRYFYADKDKADIKLFGLYTYHTGSPVSKLGDYILHLRNLMCFTTKRDLLDLLKNGTSRANPGNLASMVVYAISAEINGKVSGDCFENIAKIFIIDLVFTNKQYEFATLFLEKLNEIAQELLCGPMFNKENKILFEAQIIKLNRELKP